LNSDSPVRAPALPRRPVKLRKWKTTYSSFSTPAILKKVWSRSTSLVVAGRTPKAMETWLKPSAFKLFPKQFRLNLLLKALPNCTAEALHRITMATASRIP